MNRRIHSTARSLGTSSLLTTYLVAGSLGCIVEDDELTGIDERNAEIVENLLAAGYSEDDIEIRDDELLVDDHLEAGQFVFVEGDMHVTLAASQELLGESAEDGESFRHWRTPGLVSNGSAMICLAMVTMRRVPMLAIRSPTQCRSA